MQIEYMPLLQPARELLNTPRGFERFKQYIDTIVGGGDDVALLPLVGMNPMSRGHVAERLDRLIAMDADQIAGLAGLTAGRELHTIDARFKLGIVIADDVMGGWTNRYTTDFKHRFENAAAIKRGWISVMLWASEEPTPDTVRAAVRSAIGRTAHVLRYGEARTLRAMLVQEGAAAHFAGIASASLDAEELSYSRAILAQHLDATDWPTIFACLYGDPAAYALGYEQLGLAEWAGFAVAYDWVGNG
jgi:hypothetical protein